LKRGCLSHDNNAYKDYGHYYLPEYRFQSQYMQAA